MMSVKVTLMGTIAELVGVGLLRMVVCVALELSGGDMTNDEA